VISNDRFASLAKAAAISIEKKQNFTSNPLFAVSFPNPALFVRILFAVCPFQMKEFHCVHMQNRMNTSQQYAAN